MVALEVFVFASPALALKAFTEVPKGLIVCHGNVSKDEQMIAEVDCDANFLDVLKNTLAVYLAKMDSVILFNLNTTRMLIQGDTAELRSQGIFIYL